MVFPECPTTDQRSIPSLSPPRGVNKSHLIHKIELNLAVCMHFPQVRVEYDSIFASSRQQRHTQRTPDVTVRCFRASCKVTRCTKSGLSATGVPRNGGLSLIAPETGGHGHNSAATSSTTYKWPSRRRPLIFLHPRNALRTIGDLFIKAGERNRIATDSNIYVKVRQSERD
ncbi:hypothetical protein TcasGA2_TC011727 [Tribolium castaneum]|uniref:Uncharacterized protein n=1 Tax=Tribolium castaneum TaxID=7070 RepID=D6X098_TRICA|nr:hypothetical protein TcasGA2_TC011727 [Tribolium castaneum]